MERLDAKGSSDQCGGLVVNKISRTRFLVKIGRLYLERVEKLKNGTTQAITTQYKYDAADAGTFVNARKIAQKLEGQAVMFNPLTGDIF